jgi:hypothetical protein
VGRGVDQVKHLSCVAIWALKPPGAVIDPEACGDSARNSYGCAKRRVPFHLLALHLILRVAPGAGSAPPSASATADPLIPGTGGDARGSLVCLAERAAVEPLRNRLRYPKHTVAAPPGLLTNPLGHARLVLHDLPHELSRETPQPGEFWHGEVALLERFLFFVRFHHLIPPMQTECAEATRPDRRLLGGSRVPFDLRGVRLAALLV